MIYRVAKILGGAVIYTVPGPEEIGGEERVIEYFNEEDYQHPYAEAVKYAAIIERENYGPPPKEVKDV